MSEVQILSVLDKMRRDRNHGAAPPPEEAKGPQFILDQQVIHDIVDRELDARCLEPSRRAKVETFRTWARDWFTPYDGLIGQVDEEGLVSIIDHALKGQLETIKNQQPNGDWRILAFERKTERRDRVTYLRVAVLYVDLNGADNLVYIDGKPASSVKVNLQQQALPPELVEALKQGGMNGGMPAAMTAFLEAQTRLMVAQAEALERDAEPDGDEQPVKRGPGRPRKVQE